MDKNNKVFIIDGEKGKKLWGGLIPSYNVRIEEIKKVENKTHGDTFLEVYKWGSNDYEIISTSKVDMCQVEGLRKETSHCMGSFCNFCGKIIEK